MNKIENHDLIIVGSGPSGIYSAFLASMHNLNVKIIEASSEHGGQMLLFKDKPVYDMPGFINKNGNEILKYLTDQLNTTKTKISYNEKVLSITGSFPNFNVTTTLSRYKTKCIIISSGGGSFSPVKLGIPNENSYNNIHYSIKDYKIFKDKNIVIFGGGDSAVDWAHFFQSKCKKVTLIHRRNHFRAQEKLLNELRNKISILTPYKIKNVQGNENIYTINIVNVKNELVKKINCDYILVFFGQKKQIDKNIDFGIETEKNSFIVKSNMETSKEGIFAIGNVANYKGKIKMLSTAFGESATAIGAVVYKVFQGKKMSYYVKKN